MQYFEQRFSPIIFRKSAFLVIYLCYRGTPTAP